MTSTELTQALAERLAEVLPPGFDISTEMDCVTLDAPDGFGMKVWLGAADEDPTDLSLLPGAVCNAMSSVQDNVSRTLREPWPRLDAPGRQLALPGAKVAGHTLTFWYGSEDNPVIRFRPIALTD